MRNEHSVLPIRSRKAACLDRKEREKEPMNENRPEAKFDQEMRDTYTKAAKEIRYHATAFLHMMNEHGGVQTAKLLLQSNEISDGFTKLWQEGKLDISAEAFTPVEQ